MKSSNLLIHDDILLEVFKYLIEKDMSQVANINHYFNHLSENKRAWSGAFLKNFSFHDIPKSFQYMDFKKIVERSFETNKTLTSLSQKYNSLRRFWENLSSYQKAGILADDITMFADIRSLVLKYEDKENILKILAISGSKKLIERSILENHIPASFYKTMATYSVLSGNINFIIYCLQISKNDIGNLSIALYFAVIKGSIENYDYLIKQFNTTRQTEHLNTAVACNHYAMCEYLLENGVEATKLTVEYALQAGREDITDLLKDARHVRSAFKPT